MSETKTIKCPNCSGSGTVQIKPSPKKMNGQKFGDKQKNVNCPICAGDGQINIDNPQRPVRPFTSGMEASTWHGSNCERCSKYENTSESEKDAGCKPAFWVDMGFINGVIPLEMAQSIGCEVNQKQPEFVQLNITCKLKTELS